MTAPPLNLEVTRARRLFKELAGQNNHFLITILIGLDAVDRGAARVPLELSTSWNPHNPQRSVRRSREFAISALLAWLVDALQVYVHTLITAPIVVSDSVLRNKLESGSLGERVIALAMQLGSIPPKGISPNWRLFGGIAWFTLRREIELEVTSPHACKGAHDIEGLYQGLVINQTLDSVERSRKPAFKEIAALVRAMHKLVEAVDQAVLATVDLNAYLADVLGIYLSEDPVMRSAKVWGKKFERRVSAIVQIAQNYSMTVARINRSNTLTPAEIHSLAKLSPRQARQKFINVSVKS